MVTYEEALKLTIEGDAVFLVGSGFSTGAENVSEYSCAVTPQIRQMGNHLSGNAGTAYASLLA